MVLENVMRDIEREQAMQSLADEAQERGEYEACESLGYEAYRWAVGSGWIFNKEDKLWYCYHGDCDSIPAGCASSEELKKRYEERQQCQDLREHDSANGSTEGVPSESKDEPKPMSFTEWLLSEGWENDGGEKYWSKIGIDEYFSTDELCKMHSEYWSKFERNRSDAQAT